MVPWNDASASEWLGKQEAWQRLLKYICATLESDPRKYPNQIRAAAAMVILLGREGIWSIASGQREREHLVALAKRQLAQIKQMYSIESRGNSTLSGDPAYKKFMQTLDEEMRLLEARMNGEEINLADAPPSSWGDFWNLTLSKVQS